MRFLALAALLLATPAQAQQAPSLDEFGDAIHHWRNVHGADYATYRPEQVREIAENVLLYQRANGGWIENRDPTRVLDDAARAEVAAEQAKDSASFDNRNIYSQTAYLLEVHARLGDARYRDAALKGLDFMLARQVPSCGGWPHSVPAVQSYHDKITIADEVTSGNLRLLRRVVGGAGAYAAVDAKRREAAKAALAWGEACVLRLQVRQNGVPTGWAGQYDPVTLAPAQGRAFELPAIVSQETVQMLRYLMEIPQPSPEIVASVEAGVAWLKRSAIKGQRLETVKLAEPVKFQYHTATTDRQLVADASAPPIWARFYDLGDNSVVLANRDSKRVERLDQIHLERRSGYSWYGDWPAKLIVMEYPAWKARVRQ
jgi:PelA/Pel-15E family pectate lyase